MTNKNKTTVFLLAAIAVLAGLSPVKSQSLRFYQGYPGNPVNFEIDGDYQANSTTPGSLDWSDNSNTGRGVLLRAFNGSSIPGLNIIDDSQVSRWVQDRNWGCSGCVDSSQFDGTSNKNGDNIAVGTNNWTYSINGQGPQKNDLTNVMMFLKKQGTDTWLIGGAETRATNGDSHIDFEYNQAGVYITGTATNGYIKGRGPVGGRTPGDFIACIDYDNGGGNPQFTFRVWTAGGVWQLVNLVPGVDFFFQANTGSAGITSVAQNYGVSTSGNPTSLTSKLQFVEFAVRSQILADLFNNPNACNPSATMNVKTRSSQSFTAELKDFVLMPIVVTTPPKVVCTGPQCTCQNLGGNSFTVKDSVCHPTYNYTWSVVSSDATLQVTGVNTNSCTATFNTTGYGTATLKLVAVEGVCRDSSTTTITVKRKPNCSITGNSLVCPQSLTVYRAPAGMDRYEWSVSPSSDASIVGSTSLDSVVVRSVNRCGSFTLNLRTYLNGCTPGSYCDNLCQYTVTIYDTTKPVLTVPGEQTIECTRTPVWGPATATDNCSFVTIDSSFAVDTIRLGCPSNYDLRRKYRATDLCGNSTESYQTIKVRDRTAPTINCPADKTVACNTTISFDTPSASDSCSTVTISVVRNYNYVDAITGAMVYVQTWKATDACGNESDTCSQKISMGPCPRFCTYTQGAYGNAGGTHCNGQTTPVFMAGLLSTPMTIGAGSKTITFSAADVNCLIAILPGGGNAAALTNSFTCGTVQPLNNGKIYNGLLSQTITLGLNLRINNSVLGAVRLNGIYLTTATGTGGSACGSNGAPVPGTNTVRTLPRSVITYLGSNNSVNDLFQLANNALGGVYIPTTNGPSYTDISSAVDAINNAFDECRVLIGTSNVARMNSLESDAIQGVSVYPNPFSDNLHIRVDAGRNTSASVEIFNLDGRKVATVFDGSTGNEPNMEIDYTTTGLATGIYLCIVTVNGEATIQRIALMR